MVGEADGDNGKLLERVFNKTRTLRLSCTMTCEVHLLHSDLGLSKN